MEVFLSYSTMPSKFLKLKKSVLLGKQTTFRNLSHSSFLKISTGLSRLASFIQSSILMADDIILSLVIFTPSIRLLRAFQLIKPPSQRSAVGSMHEIYSKMRPNVNIAADRAVQNVLFPLQNRSLVLLQSLVWLFLPKLVRKKLQPQQPSILQRKFKGDKSRYSIDPRADRNRKSATCQKKAVIYYGQNFSSCFFLEAMSSSKVSSPIPVVSQKMASQYAVFQLLRVHMKFGLTTLGRKADCEYLAREPNFPLMVSDSRLSQSCITQVLLQLSTQLCSEHCWPEDRSRPTAMMPQWAISLWAMASGTMNWVGSLIKARFKLIIGRVIIGAG